MVAVGGHHRRTRGYRLHLVKPGVNGVLMSTVPLVGVEVSVVATRQHQQRVYGSDLVYHLLGSCRQTVLPSYQTGVGEVDSFEVGGSQRRRRASGVDLAPRCSVALYPILVRGRGLQPGEVHLVQLARSARGTLRPGSL